VKRERRKGIEKGWGRWRILLDSFGSMTLEAGVLGIPWKGSGKSFDVDTLSYTSGDDYVTKWTKAHSFIDADLTDGASAYLCYLSNARVLVLVVFVLDSLAIESSAQRPGK
jgi:hypothetical protein